MSVSGRTIARLAKPFDGGGGPSHTSLDRIWLSEDAGEYLPSEGNKTNRVIGGLRALRDGRRASSDGPALPPDPGKLARVASELAQILVSQGLIDEDDVAEALDATTTDDALMQSQPTQESPARRRSKPPAPTEPEAGPSADSNAPIFVVHGHDHALLHETVRMLERSTSREVIVLHEQPNAGRTILEKFEAHAATASYAVVLVTGDDVGGAAGKSTALRGRQNVIFELGFFFGRLGRERVAVLLAPGVEEPSDISGLVYIPVDSGGAWKHQLARELDAAAIPVDHKRIP